ETSTRYRPLAHARLRGGVMLELPQRRIILARWRSGDRRDIAAPQHRLNLEPQNLGIHGFRQERIAAGSERIGLRQWKRRYGDDRQPACPARFAKPPDRLEPIDPRHRKIHHDDVRPKCFRFLERDPAIGRGKDDATLRAKILRVDEPGVRVVVDDQNGWWREFTGGQRRTAWNCRGGETPLGPLALYHARAHHRSPCGRITIFVVCRAGMHLSLATKDELRR